MKNVFFLLLALFLFSCAKNKVINVNSPEGNIQISFEINNSSKIFYSVKYVNITIIEESLLGFQTEENSDIEKTYEMLSFSEIAVNQKWNPVYGEHSEITDNYNQTVIHLKEKGGTEREFEVTFRAYNEGIAFKTTFLPKGENDNLKIEKELTEFKLPANYDCWASERAQSEIHKIPVNTLSKPVERPLVIETGEYLLALGEARLVDFARLKFKYEEKQNTLVAALDGEIAVKLPYTTPWRTVMIAKSPGELLSHNYFYENLNDPCEIKDVSWIKPGKVIREVTLTTQGGLACVDFAAENGLQYVEFDAGWYGPENDENSDATTVTVDPKRSPGPLDLPKVIEYGNSKGIGIILYVNRRALEKQIDEILPLYKTWGIKGVKYGFVQVGSQEWTTWLHEAVRKAAENKLMVDIHDEYRPTGFSRTFPNLITQEGIRGDEESPTNEHTLKTLFTRMLAGAGDNTNCYFAPRVTEKMGGHVSQLAKAVMLYSPWQFLFWYDRPQGSPGSKGGAGSSVGFIQNVPELVFYKNLPTIWDDTKILEGEIGQYATIARRSGNDWFLGSLTADKERKINIDFSFLEPDLKYSATIYSYDPGSDSITKVKIETQSLDSGKTMEFDIGPNSGLAMRIECLN